MTLSPAFLDELRARTSLTSLIERKVKLTKAGREEKGCCPFHGEKTASFYVNDDKGFYHCFGCAAHGDAIRWMTDHEGMAFMDAVKELAAAAGLEMPARDPQHAERDREREEMIAIMEKVARIFTGALESDEVGIPAREYLMNRGIDPCSNGFGIGWSIGRGQTMPLHEMFKPDQHPMLVKLGLAKIHDDGPRKGQIYDFFRGRVMFPIHDTRGRVIGFGGRILGDGQPKYLNSPDTPIFDKGSTLFNAHRAAPAARAAGRLLVVEGYMDVIGLSSVGVTEVVAPNGTALTEAQIQRLWRMAEVPILCFDGDKAGRAAAARAAIRALPLLEPGKSLSFVTPPDGKDPDDVARGGGRAAVNEMLAKPRPLADVLWSHERDAQPAETPEQVAGLKARLREHVRSIRNADVREAYGQDMAKRFRATFDAVSEGVVAGPRRAPMQRPSAIQRSAQMWRERPQTSQSKSIGRNGMALNVERSVLAGLLRFPHMARMEMEATSAAKFSSAAAAALRDAMVDAAFENREFVVPDHLEQAAHWARTSPLKFSFTTASVNEVDALRDLAEAIYQLRR